MTLAPNPSPYDQPDLSHLEPGCDDNPLEYPEVYNPLRYCYLVPTTIDDIQYELAVRFLLQQYKDQDPVHFVDPKTGTAHDIPLFPKVPDGGIGLEPQIGPEPDLIGGYQLGEQTYYLVPSIVRVRRIDEGHPPRLISRQAASHLISPDILATALNDYHEQVAQDDEAPAGLLELLSHWDATQAWKWDETGDFTGEEYDEEDYDD